MLSGTGSDLDSPGDLCRLPPVTFENVAGTTMTQEAANAEGRQPLCRRIARGESADGSGIEVIVMVVRKNDDVDWRKVVERESWWNPSAWAGELYRRRPLTPDRIEQNVERAELKQKGAVADPGQRRFIGRSPWLYKLGCRELERRRIGVGAPRIPATLDQRPLQEVAKAMQLRRRPRVLESAAGPMVFRRR
jgi:hypothetical protein